MSSVIKALHATSLRNRLQPHSVIRAGLLGILLFAVFQLQPTRTALQQVQQRGELVVTGVSGPTTFHTTSIGTRGLQYELAKMFADELGVRLVLEDGGNTSGVLSAIRHNHTDLAITGLASDDPRLTRLRTATPYMAVSEQLVQRLDRPLPASFDALGAARIGVLAGSSEAQRLKALTQWRSDIQVIEFENTDPLTLIERVDNGELDFAALNSSEFDARRSLFPNVGVSLNLQDYSELAWAFLKTRDRSLYNAAQAFLARKQADGTLGRLVAFYSQSDSVDPYSLRTFQRDIVQRLPRYRLMFKHNAEKHGMDWQLLAAIAYQESHWEASAVSPTGVQGIMMLTNDTASFMGVEDRSSPRQSISGGAAYYKMIVDNLATVPEPDRTWMALAAYNMGPGYIDRARERAHRAHEDGNKWLVVSYHLRNMADEARHQGRVIPVGQALHYVQQVRRYYDALVLANSAGIDNRVAMNGPAVRGVQ
ncbi:MAG TPA: membrane-bound lytic murein transglycosylase MltF [Moraxellaceae bacterium]|nr:membrane-bound lytic murein transglycosylase MltF [Moraxellaceae bacterium]